MHIQLYRVSNGNGLSIINNNKFPYFKNGTRGQKSGQADRTGTKPAIFSRNSNRIVNSNGQRIAGTAPNWISAPGHQASEHNHWAP